MPYNKKNEPVNLRLAIHRFREDCRAESRIMLDWLMQKPGHALEIEQHLHNGTKPDYAHETDNTGPAFDLNEELLEVRSSQTSNTDSAYIGELERGDALEREYTAMQLRMAAHILLNGKWEAVTEPAMELGDSERHLLEWHTPIAPRDEHAVELAQTLLNAMQQIVAAYKHHRLGQDEMHKILRDFDREDDLDDYMDIMGNDLNGMKNPPPQHTRQEARAAMPDHRLIFPDDDSPGSLTIGFDSHFDLKGLRAAIRHTWPDLAKTQHTER